jgi:nitrate reductase assembly molybdenum cofactor insertion protein NarJ
VEGELNERDLKRIYLLSLIFSYPSEEVLERIKEVSKGVDLGSALKSFTDANKSEIETEYTALFVNSYPTLPCPPYESYYREGRLYGDSTEEVRRIYRQNGLEFSHVEAPDHISAELEFLALTGDREFFERMKEWIFDFTSRLKSQKSIYMAFSEELERIFEKPAD